MGLMQRNKGKRGECDVVRLILPLYPLARSKRAGGESALVDRGRDILGTPGLCIQVHLGQSATPQRKLAEAVAGALGTEDMPVAFTRRDREEWVVTLRAADFLALMDQVEKLRGNFARSVLGSEDATPIDLARGPHDD